MTARARCVPATRKVSNWLTKPPFGVPLGGRRAPPAASRLPEKGDSLTKIFLLRHAKAARAAPGMSDFDRPLEASGRNDALKVGRVLVERWGAPERVLCSASRRTRETLEASQIGLPAERATFSRELFSGDVDEYLAALQGETAASVLLIGHNPIIHHLALALAGGGDRHSREALDRDFPTAALAVLDFTDAIEPGQGSLEAMLLPAEIPRS